MRTRRNEFVMSCSTLQSIALVLAILLIADPLASAAHKPRPTDLPSQVKALGIGHSAIVQLSDGSHMKGKITAIDATSFTLDRGRRHGTETLSFADVAHIERSCCTTGEKIGFAVFGAGVGIGIVALVLYKRSGFGSGSWGNFCTSYCP